MKVSYDDKAHFDIMKYFIIFIIYNTLLILLYYSNSILNIINMYKNINKSVFVLIEGGLGNRLMSFAGTIVLSIYFQSKPFCIMINILE